MGVAETELIYLKSSRALRRSSYAMPYHPPPIMASHEDGSSCRAEPVRLQSSIAPSAQHWDGGPRPS